MNRQGGSMSRYEFNLVDVRISENAKKDLSEFLKGELSKLGLPFFIDDKLLFWKQHFSEDDSNDFAIYPNGYEKGGTLRFKEGHIRIPSSHVLAVHESEEYKLSSNPRLWVTLDEVVICQAKELTKSELFMDGFRNHKDMIINMRSYYPTINPNSIVSFYTFGMKVKS